MSTYSQDDLRNLAKHHDHFVGIDSDGCVFDTMGVKQIQHFHPLILKFYGLAALETEVRAAAEFVNLYSAWRGQNRFPALLKTFDLLAEWPEVVAGNTPLPETAALRAYCESGLPLGNPSLLAEVDRTGDPELKRALAWSLAVNEDINAHMAEVPPFPSVEPVLTRMGTVADLVVVSQTPEEALVKEWDLHELRHFVEVIAGQELGTKAEHLVLATEQRWTGDHILMIGDAQGDRKAAAAVNACFYPINPGQEEASWKRLGEEAFDRFMAGTYAGAYEQSLIAEFEALLPEIPPWKNQA